MVLTLTLLKRLFGTPSPSPLSCLYAFSSALALLVSRTTNIHFSWLFAWCFPLRVIFTLLVLSVCACFNGGCCAPSFGG